MSTFLQIQRQIDRLRIEANAIRTKEAAAMIERIKLAIQHYALTPSDLFAEKRSKAPAK